VADQESAEDAGERGRLDRGRADDVLYQEFGQPQLDIDKGHDGLPGVRPSTDMPHAPPLAVESFVCMADRSTFVIRRPRWGTVVATFQPAEVKRSESGLYYVDFLDAIDHGAPWPLVLRLMEYSTGRVPVEPIRPQCSFLARQMVDLQDSTENILIERLCTARRDEQSFFLSVRDSQVHACELRNPPAPKENARLDLFDDRKIALGKERRERPDAFDVDRALAQADEDAKDTTPYGGIFADRPSDT
jgi:hypothetical protein